MIDVIVNERTPLNSKSTDLESACGSTCTSSDNECGNESISSSCCNDTSVKHVGKCAPHMWRFDREICGVCKIVLKSNLIIF